MQNFKLLPLAFLIGLMVADLHVAQAREYFNPELLQIDNPAQAGADLSVFEDGDSQAPGVYRVDILLNGQMINSREVEFVQRQDDTGKSGLHPCLSTSDLAALGVNVAAFSTLTEDNKCVDLAAAIPNAYSEFRFSNQQLNLSIPQAALKSEARGYVTPDQWQHGVTALLVNYNFSGSNARIGDNAVASNSYYLNLRSGLNVGPWRLRNYSVWNQENGQQDRQQQGHWQSINTYLQRDIAFLKSQLTLGDTNSSSEIFDSVPMRGGQLMSDEEMLPESLRGYSPVVRGIARTNAQVTIRQNGYVIYQSHVPAGAFEISDLYPTAGSGDLNVTITEADGSEQRLVVPFASVPVLQREGQMKYNLAGGRYRPADSHIDETPFAQGSVIYGLPWGITAYGGVQAAPRYNALALGLGKNMGTFGAFSADVTQARATLANEPSSSGQSLRLRYGKSFADTGTNVSLAGYRYSTKGFYTLQETLDSSNPTSTQSFDNQQHKRSRMELTVNQNLGPQAGSLSLSMVDEGYWNGQKTQSTGVGYNNSWRGISYGINYSHSKNALGNSGSDRLLALNVNIPLSGWLNNTWATYGVNNGTQGRVSHSLGLNGTALEQNNLNWAVAQSYNQQNGSSGNLSASYRGNSGQLNTGYNYGNQQQQFNYGVQGGILVHENGVTLSQPLGETVALVKAPGAKGVGVANNIGVKTDWRGYAVVPYVTPYRNNALGLDTATLPDDVEMELTSKTVTPTRGAVVVADYQPRIGQRVMMTMMRANGNPVPFGATVTELASTGENSSIVGDGGEVYLTGLAEKGTLQVQWGKGNTQQCQVNYRLPARSKQNTGLPLVNGQCL
ncbi:MULTISPECIES: fimbria/pilus outer membrane usher protein [unclassified Serratia (in: enterobacteria)]|uniref:fimbria/pilus outer membrane usher protein n=1 Tax=unclassified Serratia (in: enterobacteria) TaxID=2647522 RepID=UPI00050528F6|nr:MULTISPECIES: fimbria/pilus outer membrane usher protein [unclassified Serratia (in: enterobacteria)]KFK95433.1 fimbrial assembly protein [Serratia sp. Ag2]KFK98781.1 fimbrial assembly protein [Serratia sp. Ag1]